MVVPGKAFNLLRIMVLVEHYHFQKQYTGIQDTDDCKAFDILGLVLGEHPPALSKVFLSVGYLFEESVLPVHFLLKVIWNAQYSSAVTGLTDVSNLVCIISGYGSLSMQCCYIVRYCYF